MGFMDKLTRSMANAGETLSSKLNEVANTTSLKTEKKRKEGELDACFLELGREIYKHKDKIDLPFAKEHFTQIEEIRARIEELEARIAEERAAAANQSVDEDDFEV